MSRKTIIILILLAFSVVAALIAWKWTFKKTDVSVSKEKATVEIEAAVLTREFENDEMTSNDRYLGKVITVTGAVNSLSDDEQNFLVYLKNEEDISGVMCSFHKASFDANTVRTGDQVKIKGLCAGYLMDVQLTKCSLEP